MKEKKVIALEQISTVVEAAREARAWETCNVDWDSIPFTEETQRLFGEIGVEGEIYEIPADIELSDEAFKAMEEFCCTFRCEWLEQGLFRGNGRPILKAFKWNGRRFIVINEWWFPQWADKWLAVRLFFKLREEDDE